MATHYLLKNKTLILNATIEYYPLKDSKGLFFSSFSLESLNPSKNFLNFFIIFTSYQILLHFFFLILFSGILEFWCLVTVTFKFTVLIIFIEKENKKMFLR